jgi:hypothetical protein
MSAAKSIEAIDGQLNEIVKEMAAEFARRNLSHPLSLEATVLWDTKRKLSAIGSNGIQSPAAEKAVAAGRTGRRGKQPKGAVAQHEAAMLAVKAASHPLQTSELVEAMPAHGAQISGPNAERNLTSILSKRGDLASVRWRDKRAWWPKGERLPA